MAYCSPKRYLFQEWAAVLQVNSFDALARSEQTTGPRAGQRVVRI